METIKKHIPDYIPSGLFRITVQFDFCVSHIEKIRELRRDICIVKAIDINEAVDKIKKTYLDKSNIQILKSKQIMGKVFIE